MQRWRPSGTALVSSGTTTALVNRIHYYPYGRTHLVEYGSGSSSVETDRLFTGQQKQPNSPIYHGARPERSRRGARMYNPEVGRMLAMDARVPGAGVPWRDDQYGYAYNSPATFTDPSGNIPIDSSGDPLIDPRDYSVPSLQPPGGRAWYEQSGTLTKPEIVALLVDLGFDNLQASCWTYGPRSHACAAMNATQSGADVCDPAWACYGSAGVPHCTLDQQLSRTCPLKPTGGFDLFEELGKAVTSECAQGIFALGATLVITAGVVTSGVGFISSGSIVTGAAVTVGGSALVGAGVALGPVPADTLLQVGELTTSAIGGIRNC